MAALADGGGEDATDEEDEAAGELVRISLAAAAQTAAGGGVAFATQASGLTPRGGRGEGFFGEAARDSLDSGNISLALVELVETERRFCERVRVLVEGFQRPMERWASEPGGAVSAEEVRRLFGNAAEVLEWSVAFHGDLEACFAAALAARADAWTTAARVGDVVFGAATRGDGGNMRRVFSTYSRHFEASRSALEALEARGPARAFVRALELHPSAGNLPLGSYLAEPVQRVPRYGLLLDEALRRCPERGDGDGDLHVVAVVEPCRHALARARDAVRLACGDVDKSVHDGASLAATAAAMRLPWLAVPQRVLLHRGTLAKSTKRGGRRDVSAAVFNDLFLYGTDRPKAAFKLRKVIAMRSAVVVDKALVYSADRPPFPTKSKRALDFIGARVGLEIDALNLDASSFLVDGPEKSGVVMTAQSPAAKQKWIEAFVAAQSDPLHRRAPRDAATAETPPTSPSSARRQMPKSRAAAPPPPSAPPSRQLPTTFTL